MIRDTCPCGAEFEVEHATAAIPSSSEQRAHNQWLEAHKHCRVEIDGVPTDRPECPKCGGVGASDYEKMKTAIRNPWISLFMDGRNEHGTHLLPVPPDGICLSEKETEDLLDSRCTDCERVFSEAEQSGYIEGCCIVVACLICSDDGGNYYEMMSIDVDLTRLIHGGPDEQRAALDRLSRSASNEN